MKRKKDYSEYGPGLTLDADREYFGLHPLEKESVADVKKKEKQWLRCPICPPNKGENSKRKAKHGNKKPKYKDKR